MFLLQTEVPRSEITSNLMMPIWESNPHNLIDQSLLPWGGGESYMKQRRMLAVSLRGVNFGFWSRLGCLGQSADILSRQDLA